MEYGVNVTNKFAFLDEDEDPEEVLAKVKDEKKHEKAAAPVVKAKAAEAPKAAAAKPVEPRSTERPPRGGDQTGKPMSGGGAGRGPPRGGGQQQNNRDRDGNRRGGRNGVAPGGKPKTGDSPNADAKQTEPRSTERPQRGDYQSGRPGGGRRGAPRGGGQQNNNYRGGDGGRRRNYDEPQQPKSEAEQQDKVAPVVESSQQDAFPDTGDFVQSWDTPIAPPADENATGEDAEKPINGGEDAEAEAEPPRVLTLEEWRAEQKKEEPQFKVRKPGEGGDTKIYQKLVPLKIDAAKDKDHHDSEEEQHIHKEKREKPLSFDVQFVDNNKRGYGGDRGGRFGGGGDRGGPRDRDGGGRGGGGFRGPPRDRDGGGRGGGGGPRGEGRSYNNTRPGPGPSGSGGRRPQQGSAFNLESEQFPALGAAH